MNSKKKTKFLSIAVYILIAIVVLVSGYSFAYWQKEFTQSGISKSTSGCFNVTYQESNSGTSSTGGYPVSDEEGLQTTPYTVTITNTCDTYVKYNIIYNVLSTSTLSPEYVKVGVNGVASLLTSHTQTTARISGAKSYIVGSGALKKGASATVNVNSWMDINTTSEQGYGKVLNSKITFETSASFDKLYAFIKRQTTSDGLYSVTGASVTNEGEIVYYYKGTNPNNHLIMNGIKYRIIRVNEDDTVRIITEDVYASKSFFGSSSSAIYVDDENETSDGFVTGALNNWYKANIKNTSYETYVAQNGTFCNDVSGTVRFNIAQNTPSFKCSNSMILSLKVGLITADETIFAGGNNSYLVPRDDWYWTFSGYNDSHIYISQNGHLIQVEPLNGNYGVYPVINLTKETKVTGIGTEDDPFVVEL